MAQWAVYNVVGDATPFIDYSFNSLGWDWVQKVDPTPDVGLVFRTTVRALTETEQQWEQEFFNLLGQHGGRTVLKYTGNTVDGLVDCVELTVDCDGDTERMQTWSGKVIDVYRVDEQTVFDRGRHEWSDVDDDLTVHGVVFSTRNAVLDTVVRGGEDPDPRFHQPLLEEVREDTEVSTMCIDSWDFEWQTADDLPACLSDLKNVPDHVKEQLLEQGNR